MSSGKAATWVSKKAVWLDSELVLGTSPHSFTLFQNFSLRTFLIIEAVLKENTKKKTKPFCTLVVARLSCRVGHLRCEGVAERNCGNYRSAFYHCGGWQLLSKNEMRKLDIFQVASNVSLVVEAGCGRRSGVSKGGFL